MKILLKSAIVVTSMAVLVVPPIREAAAQSGNNRPASPASRPSFSVGKQASLPEHAKFAPEQIKDGSALFTQNCAFCHGKDAGGGESGPDLTRSKLVSADKNGEGIGQVIRHGRMEKGMPSFGSLSDNDVVALVAFVHAQQDAAMSQTGTRKGVEESDLQTGNAQAGKQYFQGTGGCASCHSPTGDLAGVATRYTGLKLLEQMLYPKEVKAKVKVTTRSGQTFNGVLEYRDEFTIGLRDSSGLYRSWPTAAIKFDIDDPVEKHVDIMSRYTDDDMHNVLAYLQTMK